MRLFASEIKPRFNGFEDARETASLKYCGKCVRMNRRNDPGDMNKSKGINMHQSLLAMIMVCSMAVAHDQTSTTRTQNRMTNIKNVGEYIYE